MLLLNLCPDRDTKYGVIRARQAPGIGYSCSQTALFSAQLWRSRLLTATPLASLKSERECRQATEGKVPRKAAWDSGEPVSVGGLRTCRFLRSMFASLTARMLRKGVAKQGHTVPSEGQRGAKHYLVVTVWPASDRLHREFSPPSAYLAGRRSGPGGSKAGPPIEGHVWSICFDDGPVPEVLILY